MLNVNYKLLIFIVAAFIFMLLVGGKLSFSIFYASILIFIFGYLHVLFEKISMKIIMEEDSGVFSTGDDTILYTTVNSLTAVPGAYYFIYVRELANCNPEYKGNMIFLCRRKKKTVLNQVNFRIRGIYNFYETDVEFADLFSIVKCKKTFPTYNSIKVYPKIYDIDETYFTGKNIFENSRKNAAILEDSNEIRDYRRYRQGDSLKRVHWKLTAKYNEIYIKNFSEVISKDSNIFLNMSYEHLDVEYPELIEEDMIEFCVSMVNFLQNNNYKTNLFINNHQESNFQIMNSEDFNIMMEYFLENKSTGNASFGNFINSKSKKMQEGTWVGIITIKVDKDLLEEVSNMMKNGFRISIYYCIEGEERSNYSSFSEVEFVKCEKAMNR